MPYKKAFSSIITPIGLIIGMMVGLAWMANNANKNMHPIYDYKVFHSKLKQSLKTAKKYAMDNNIAVIICPVGEVITDCNPKEKCNDKLVSYKFKDDIVIKTKSSRINMQANGKILKRHIFVVSEDNSRAFPYQITLCPDLTTTTKLLDVE
jgi:hypothetical protein